MCNSRAPRANTVEIYNQPSQLLHPKHLRSKRKILLQRASLIRQQKLLYSTSISFGMSLFVQFEGCTIWLSRFFSPCPQQKRSTGIQLMSIPSPALDKGNPMSNLHWLERLSYHRNRPGRYLLKSFD